MYCVPEILFVESYRNNINILVMSPAKGIKLSEYILGHIDNQQKLFKVGELLGKTIRSIHNIKKIGVPNEDILKEMFKWIKRKVPNEEKFIGFISNIKWLVYNHNDSNFYNFYIDGENITLIDCNALKI